MASTTIHQALYGYDDGHRLLAASSDLPRADRGILLRQTDSPDAGRAEGWEALLAGYPLPSGQYALTMTWPAPEMPRPGCVWTHVLIPTPEALACADPEGLLGLFSRPGPTLRDSAAYSRPFMLPHNAPADHPGLSQGLLPLAAATAWAFYEPPVRPVRIGSIELKDHVRHRFLLALWGNQWPDLRVSTSFADAPFTPRHLGESSYDLQLQRSVRGRSLTDDARALDGIPDADPPDWAKALGRDLVHPGAAKQFLLCFGPEFKNSRGVVASLMNLWLMLRTDDKDNATRVVATLSRDFPSAQDGRRLKKTLLNEHDAALEDVSRLNEIDILCALAAAESTAAFKLQDLDLAQRVVRLAKQQPSQVSAVIRASGKSENPGYTVMLDALAASLDKQLIKRWGDADSGGLLALVRRRPLVARDPDVWRYLEPGAIWDAVRSVRGTRQRADLISAMIASGRDLDGKAVSEAWPTAGDAVAEALADPSAPPKAVAKWLAALSSVQLKVLIDNPSSQSTLVVSAARLLDPRSLAKWNPETLDRALDAAPADYAVRVLRAALLRTDARNWAPLAIRSYERVHRRVSKGSLSGKALAQAWPSLEGQTRKQMLDTIVRELNRALKDGEWPVTSTLSLADRDAFTQLVDADRHAGLARRIVADISSGPTPLEPWQQKVLVRAIVDRSDKAGLTKALESAVSGLVGAVRRVL
jgi:hypothetical protein